MSNNKNESDDNVFQINPLIYQVNDAISQEGIPYV